MAISPHSPHVVGQEGGKEPTDTGQVPAGQLTTDTRVQHASSPAQPYSYFWNLTATVQKNKMVFHKTITPCTILSVASVFWL